jgi:hypothetical protein
MEYSRSHWSDARGRLLECRAAGSANANVYEHGGRASKRLDAGERKVKGRGAECVMGPL